MRESSAESPVVASLKPRSQNPYSSICLSPSRQHAVAAAKDTLTVLSVRPNGLTEIKSLRVSQQFQAPSDKAATGRNNNLMDIRDTFGYPKPPSQSPQNMTNANVIITDVVWSLPQSGVDVDLSEAEDSSGHGRKSWKTDREADSFLAAAGSNGVFCIWNARPAFLQSGASSTTMGYPPDCVRSHSSRAVNRLAWHPTGRYPGRLLTASQDGTVKLWERKVATPKSAMEKSSQDGGMRGWFGKHERSRQSNASSKSYSWECTKTFNTKSDPVREVRWSPFHDDSKLRMLSRCNRYINSTLAHQNIRLCDCARCSICAGDRYRTFDCLQCEPPRETMGKDSSTWCRSNYSRLASNATLHYRYWRS